MPLRTLVDGTLLRDITRRLQPVYMDTNPTTMSLRLTADEHTLTLYTGSEKGFARYTMEAQTITPGNIHVNTLWFTSLANIAPNMQIDLQATSERLTLSGDTLHVSMPLMNVTPPDMPTPPDTWQTIDPGLLAGLAKRVAYARGPQTSPITHSIHLHGEQGRLFAEATDKYRVARTWTDCDWEGDMLVDGDWLTRVTDATRFTTSSLLFTATDMSMTATPLVDGDYPNLTHFFTTKDTRMTVSVNRLQLLDTVRQLKSIDLSDRKTTPIQFTPGDQRLELAMTSPDTTGRQALTATISDETHIPFMLNAAYCIDALNASTMEQVTFHVTDAIKPILLQSDGEPLTQIIVPLRNIG